MKKRIKGIFKEEENKMNKLMREINEAENLETKSELAELLLIVANNALDKLDRKFKVHKEYDDYKKILLTRKDAAESIIKTKGRSPLNVMNAVFDAFKKLLGK